MRSSISNALPLKLHKISLFSDTSLNIGRLSTFETNSSHVVVFSIGIVYGLLSTSSMSKAGKKGDKGFCGGDGRKGDKGGVRGKEATDGSGDIGAGEVGDGEIGAAGGEKGGDGCDGAGCDGG